MSDRACLFGLAVGERVLCTDSLTGIFDHEQVMLFGKRHERFHVRALTEQVHRHNRFRARRDSTTNGVDVHVHRLPFDVNHHRRQS